MENDGMKYGEGIPPEVYDIAARLIEFLEELDGEYAGEGGILNG